MLNVPTLKPVGIYHHNISVRTLTSIDSKKTLYENGTSSKKYLHNEFGMVGRWQLLFINVIISSTFLIDNIDIY